MGLFNKKINVSENEIAEVFLSEFIANEDLHPPLQIEFSDEQKESYHAMCKLYLLALVFVMLMNEENNNPKALLVREIIERRFFNQRNEKTEVFLSQLREAMVNLNELINPKGSSKELSWARSWFSKVGIEIDNLVELALFSTNWMDRYSAAVKSFREITGDNSNEQ